MAYIVALTGGIGSGKTTVANVFARLGVALVDADKIARELVAPGRPALASIIGRFGQRLLAPDGTLNRSQLRQIIFSNPKEKQWLDALLHPLIRDLSRQRLAQARCAYGLWVVPLLIESRWHEDANRVLVVDVPPEIQIQRTMQRDNLSRQQVQAILASQASRRERLAQADDIIDNTGDQQNIQAQVNRLHARYLQLALSGTYQELP